MRLPAPLLPGRLERRYKRFLADITLDTGQTVTAHCPNPGAMMGLDAPGSRVLLSDRRGTGRKLDYGLELVQAEGVWVGINTSAPNRLVAEALADGRIPELAAYPEIRPEVKIRDGTRLDFRLGGADGAPACNLEVKNVHLMRQAGLAEFPDCVTVRGAKHLSVLGDLTEAGERSVMLYIVQRPDCSRFALAADLDPGYAAAFAGARSRGVEMLVYGCSVTPEEIAVGPRLRLDC